MIDDGDATVRLEKAIDQQLSPSPSMETYIVGQAGPEVYVETGTILLTLNRQEREDILTGKLTVPQETYERAMREALSDAAQYEDLEADAAEQATQEWAEAGEEAAFNTPMPHEMADDERDPAGWQEQATREFYDELHRGAPGRTEGDDDPDSLNYQGR